MPSQCKFSVALSQICPIPLSHHSQAATLGRWPILTSHALHGNVLHSSS